MKTNNTKKNNTVANNTIVCPNCGAEFEVTPVGHTCNVEPATDTNVAYTSKPALAIKLLEGVGVDTSNFFALNLGGGKSVLARRDDNGAASVVEDDDPIFMMIRKDGTVANPHLFRRWVLAQLAHMEYLDCVSYNSHNKKSEPIGVHAAIQRKGYEYSIKMLTEELRVQEVLYRHRDTENFRDRNAWFNKTVAYDYEKQLREYIDSLAEKRCKGVPYKRIQGIDVFNSDLYKLIFWPLRSNIYAIEHAKTPKALYEAFRDFRKLSFKTSGKRYTDVVFTLKNDAKMCKAFVDAYKGVGGHAAAKNMILFHNCLVSTVEGVVYDRKHSLYYLDMMRDACARDFEGWKMLGFWKHLVEFNGIDFKKKQAEWRKAKKERQAAKAAAKRK